MSVVRGSDQAVNRPKPGAVFLDSDFCADSYNNEDKAFLQAYFETYPETAARFDAYLAVDPAERMDKAWADLGREKRTGFSCVSSDPENAQTVREHTEQMAEFAREIFPNRAEIDSPKFEELIYMIKLHDLCEALVTDIPNTTEDYGLNHPNRKDKARIEGLASALLFEGFPDELALVHEYEARSRSRTKLVKAIDALELIHQSIVTEGREPGNREPDGSSKYEPHISSALAVLGELYPNHKDVPKVFADFRDKLLAERAQPSGILPYL